MSVMLNIIKEVQSIPFDIKGGEHDKYTKLLRGRVRTFDKLCKDFAEQFKGFMTPKDDIIEVISPK